MTTQLSERFDQRPQKTRDFWRLAFRICEVTPRFTLWFQARFELKVEDHCRWPDDTWNHVISVLTFVAEAPKFQRGQQLEMAGMALFRHKHPDEAEQVVQAMWRENRNHWIYAQTEGRTLQYSKMFVEEGEALLNWIERQMPPDPKDPQTEDITDHTEPKPRQLRIMAIGYHSPEAQALLYAGEDGFPRFGMVETEAVQQVRKDALIEQIERTGFDMQPGNAFDWTTYRKWHAEAVSNGRTDQLAALTVTELEAVRHALWTVPYMEIEGVAITLDPAFDTRRFTYETIIPLEAQLFSLIGADWLCYRTEHGIYGLPWLENQITLQAYATNLQDSLQQAQLRQRQMWGPATRQDSIALTTEAQKLWGDDWPQHLVPFLRKQFPDVSVWAEWTDLQASTAVQFFLEVHLEPVLDHVQMQVALSALKQLKVKKAKTALGDRPDTRRLGGQAA